MSLCMNSLLMSGKSCLWFDYNRTLFNWVRIFRSSFCSVNTNRAVSEGFVLADFEYKWCTLENGYSAKIILLPSKTCLEKGSITSYRDRCRTQYLLLLFLVIDCHNLQEITVTLECCTGERSFRTWRRGISYKITWTHIKNRNIGSSGYWSSCKPLDFYFRFWISWKIYFLKTSRKLTIAKINVVWNVFMR